MYGLYTSLSEHVSLMLNMCRVMHFCFDHFVNFCSCNPRALIVRCCSFFCFLLLLWQQSVSLEECKFCSVMKRTLSDGHCNISDIRRKHSKVKYVENASKNTYCTHFLILYFSLKTATQLVWELTVRGYRAHHCSKVVVLLA